MYGFIIPDKGLALLHGLLAGETFAITRCMVGTGRLTADTDPHTLADLVEPIAQATSTQPLARDKQVDFTVEYRNDLNGGLDTAFLLREFGIFARDKAGDEVLVYYGTLGDYPLSVQAYTENGVEIKRFPVSIALNDEPDVVIEYAAGAFMTAEEVANYCTVIVLPMFLEQAAVLINEHNLDPKSHPYILGLIGQLDSRVSLIELQYSTDVNGNPFRVTFENLDAVNVQGVWNQQKARVEF